MHQQRIQEVKASKIQAAVVADLLEVMEDLPPVKIEVVHLFSVGYYARIMKVKAGSLIVSKKHATRHPSALSKGTMRILEQGVVREVVAPAAGETQVGTQRVGYAVTDCDFITVHKTNKTTLAEIEAEVIDNSEEDLCLGR